MLEVIRQAVALSLALLLGLLLALSVCAAPVLAQRAHPPGAVCPDPAHPCPGFRPHDLSFVLPTDAVARAEDCSAPFFAVMLRSAPRCAIAERERLAEQARFPDRKVFTGRFECDDDVENNVRYGGVDERYGFLAVYGGATAAEARALLATVRASGRYPGANVRRMRVVRVNP